jgi:GAF domain-containing protein
MAVDRIRLAEGLAAIVADVPGQEDLPEGLCQACLAALPVDGVGLSLMTNEHAGGRMLLGATDAVGNKIEELQFSLGEGPCVTAFSEARPVLVSDVKADEARGQWPAFAEQVVSTGVRSLFAFPLQVGVIGIGVLDCHRAQPGPLEEVTEALVVATAVTSALLDYEARVLSAAEVRPELIELSWLDHATVHQATGMVSSQLNAPTDTALARLRAYAFREGQPLKEVAGDVVARRLRFTSEDGG